MSKFLKLSLLPLFLFALIKPSLAAESTFKDVNEDNDYFMAVEYLARTGVLEGNPDGSFLPLNKINRAEVTKLVVTMQKINPEPSVFRNCFSDVSDQWFAPYICYAKEQGWIQGYPDGYFRPGNLVNEAEMFKMVLEPLFGDEIEKYEEIMEMIEMVERESVSYSFEENTSEEQWFDRYVDFAYDYHIDDGYDFSFEPSESSIRGRVAQFIFNAIMFGQHRDVFDSEYIRDSFLIADGFEEILPTPRCYSSGTLYYQNFPFKYLQDKYGIDLNNIVEKDFFGPDDKPFPFYDPGYFCIIKDGFLFSMSIALSEKDFSRHLIRFDENGRVIKDQSENCPFWSYSWEITEAENFDPETANLLHCFVLKDKDSIYFEGENNEVNRMDSDSFKLLRLPYSKDANHAYYSGEVIWEADPESFAVFESEKINEDGFVLYAKDKEHVFESGYLQEAYDVETFEPIGNHYAQDKNGTYFFGKLIEGAEAQTLVPIYTQGFQALYDEEQYFYAKDQKHVFINGILIPQADPSTFEVMGWGYSRDSRNLYYYNKIVQGANPNTFQLFQDLIPNNWESISEWGTSQAHGFAVDQENIYIYRYDEMAYTIPLDQINIEEISHFKLMQSPVFKDKWARDDNAVYLMGIALDEVYSPVNFEFINEYYSQDWYNVFYLEEGMADSSSIDFSVILGADPETFEALTLDGEPYPLAKDASRIYYKNQVVNSMALDINTTYFDPYEKTLKDATGYTCQIDESTESILQCKK